MPRRKAKRPNLYEMDQAHPVSADLREEIAILREMIRRVMDEAGGNLQLEEALKILNSLGLGASRLANLLKTQEDLRGGLSDVEEALRQAILEFAHERGLDRLEDGELPLEGGEVSPEAASPQKQEFSPASPQLRRPPTEGVPPREALPPARDKSTKKKRGSKPVRGGQNE